MLKQFSCFRTSMLLYGVSADLHDEYFSVIMILISSHYMANYGTDPIWPDPRYWLKSV